MLEFHNTALRRIRTDRRGCIILSGPPGLYQTQDAAILAEKALGGNIQSHPDLLEYHWKDVSNSIAVVEEIASKITLLPSKADRYVVIIEGIEQFSPAAQHKFLKTLEDGAAFFILITYGNVLNTIESRSMIIPYRPLSLPEFLKLGKAIPTYFLMGGCPEAVTDTEVEEIFRKAGEAFNASDVKAVLSCLHLVKEKDNKNFYNCYKLYVPALFAYIGKLILDNHGSYQVIMRAAEASVHCRKSYYTGADFFRDIVALLPYERK